MTEKRYNHPAPAIACLGDSITFGFPYGPEFSWVNLAALETGLTMLNFGLNGDTTSGMLSRMQKYVIPGNPDWVVITGGTNDAWLGCGLDEVKYNFERMIELAREHGMRPVMGIPIPVNLEARVDFFGIHDLVLLSERLESYKKWMREFTLRENITIIDFHAALVEPHTGCAVGSFYSDNGHPNRDGYRKMAGQAVKTLMALCQ